MNNEEKSKTVDELCGSLRDPHNYDERYYHQQAKEIAAVTAIAMIRDRVSSVDIRTVSYTHLTLPTICSV